MNCRQARGHLPGYLDGAIRARHQARVRQHLTECDGCRKELESYRRLSLCLGHVQPFVAPVDLAMNIRLRASRVETGRAFVARLWGRARLVFENILEPLAVPATGGLLTAVILFVLLAQSLALGMPVGAVSSDFSTSLIQPARLESLAPFPVQNISEEGSRSGSVLVIEATVNAQGQVVNYSILAGPTNTAARRQIDQFLLFSKFRPQMSFGRPTPGGRVLLNFSEIRVRG